MSSVVSSSQIKTKTNDVVVVESEIRDHDEFNVKESYAEAKKASDDGCMPFGAVLSDDKGTILVRASNPTKASSKRGGGGGSNNGDNDCTAHAECTLLRKQEFKNLSSEERQNSTLYSSTEPCVMCAGAIWWSGIGRVVYGCTAEQLECQVSGPGGFDVPIRDLYGMASKNCRNKRIEIAGPILEEDGLQIHRESNVWNFNSNNSNSNSNAQCIKVPPPLTDEENEEKKAEE